LDDIQNGIRLLGKILDKPEQAEALISYHKDSEAYFKQIKLTVDILKGAKTNGK